MKKKVLFINGSGGNNDYKVRLSGPKRVTYELAKRLENYDYKLFSFKGNVLCLLKIVFRYNPKIIHGHGSLNMGFLLIILKIFFNKKTIVTFTDFKKNFIDNYKILNHLDLVIVQTDYAKKKLIKNGVREDKIKKIIYGVETEFKEGKKCEEIRKLSENIVLYYGDARKERGFDLLLETIPLVVNNAFFLICIRSTYENVKFKKFYDKKNVKFLGVEQYPCSIAELISSVDLVVLPFLENTFEPPLTIMETTSVGKALITSNVGGNSEVISKNGMIIKELTPECLARSIEGYLKKKKKNHARKFDWKNTVKRIEEIYR